MTELKDRIESIFWATLEEEPVVYPWGLCAEFKRENDFAHSVRIYRGVSGKRSKFQSAALCELTEEFGVISLTNAFLNSSNPNLDLSGSDAETTVGLQDPFHFDPYKGVTLLQKHKDMTREVPTYYSFANEVRKALADFDRKGLSRAECIVLDLIQNESYQFSLEGHELEIREMIQYALRDLTRSVFELIPEGKKFEKSWMSDKGEVVLHSNRPNFVVHGRPASDSTHINNLCGIVVEP